MGLGVGINQGEDSGHTAAITLVKNQVQNKPVPVKVVGTGQTLAVERKNARVDSVLQESRAQKEGLKRLENPG